MSTLLRLPTATRVATTPLQPIHADRLIIATNRGPVEYFMSQQQVLKPRRGAGGVVTALVGAAKNIDVSWVAMAMTEGDRIAIKERQQDGVMKSPLRDQNMLLRYVAIPKTAYRKHYEQISNQLLWFVQHYMYDSNGEEQSNRKIQDAWNNGYMVANRAIADAVNAEIERGEGTPVVMLHDYHLYLAPATIREVHPTIIMQQFIHIPWPDIRCWQLLPGNISEAIFNGLVGNDIIGFQTERDAHNFMEGARTILDGSVVDFESGAIWWKGHHTQVRAYPISISVTDEKRQAQSLAGKRAVEPLRPLLEKQTIMRVDRIEPTKNILRGFQAYALMLEQHPELRGAVNFLAFLVPSRQTLSKYKRLGSDVEKLVNEINERFGTMDWKPITAFYENDRVQALAAMRFYDVLLVNPIIDGMNLVAKEGPVVNRQNGVLVLSRTAGAFQQLGKAAIPVTSTDVAETANALYQALTMPRDERRAMSQQARHAVEDHDLNEWLQCQFDDINALLDRLSARVSAHEAIYSVPVENAG
ncbi:MAG TPA: trehalose-6-phosphate synthase [Ktedonobacteraceae bacterium]|nr:trehalose-6-phosphate synthase [Ktedonobacteraceae bacterium]